MYGKGTEGALTAFDPKVLDNINLLKSENVIKLFSAVEGQKIEFPTLGIAQTPPDGPSKHRRHNLRDRFGQPRARTEIAIKRDSTIAFARLTRELDLDAGSPSNTAQPPALISNRR